MKLLRAAIVVSLLLVNILPAGLITSVSQAVSSPISPANLIEESVNPFLPVNSSKETLSQVQKDLALLIGNKNLKTPTPLISKLETDFVTAKNSLEKIRTDLLSRNVSAKIITRLDNFKGAYITQISSIIKTLKSGAGASTAITNFLKPPSFPEKNNQNPSFHAVEFNGVINKAPVSEFQSKFQSPIFNNSLKNLINTAVLKNLNQAPSFPFPEDQSGTISNFNTPPLPTLSLTSPPVPEDFTESEEIQFSASIKDLALSLNYDPIAISNYVANNIEFIPYYGSKKGATATLVERAGNDFDIASLLIALLRVGDGSGGNKTPAHYKLATVKFDLSQVMDLLGVDDPYVAATVLEKTGIPYTLYVDQNQNPAFFVLDLTYVEAYVDYDYTRGAVQGNPGAPKRWVPLIPSLSKFYKSQHLNAVEAMSFNVQSFYDDYLNGAVSNQKPIDALKTQIQNYLTASQPDVSYDDTLTQTFRSENNLEFLPLTTPFEIVSSIATLTAAPENLKHRINFLVQSENGSQVFLDNSVNVSSLADKELILDYIAASPEDQVAIDSFPTIYDVVPLSLVNLKPVMKINGSVVSGGGTNPLSIPMGATQTFRIVFKEPQKKLAGLITEKISETVQKSTISGNTEGLALNTDRVVPPESRPAADTATASAVSNQKLYKTAQNFLYRLESSHDELSRIFGASFTNTAARANVFNGLEINYQNGQPYSFSWTGLRIDSSSFINYYNHFGSKPNRYQKEFLSIFGLQASLDEASIFEDNFNIQSMSTVKGLRLINQNQIPGATVNIINSSNISALDGLSISAATKSKLRAAVETGDVVYIPSSPLTYLAWNGLVYIDFNPQTGAGSYIIGEGLNGGYTATDVNSWPEPLKNLFILGMRIGTIPVANLTATIISPVSGQQFTKGAIIPLEINYSGTLLIPPIPISWTEKENLDTSGWVIGNHPLVGRYGAVGSISITILGDSSPSSVGCSNNLEGRTLPATSGRIGEEMHLPLWINTNSGVFRERWNNQVQFKIQDDIRSHPNAHDFFTELFGDRMTVNNENNPWIDSTITNSDHYWNMSITFGAFWKPALNEDHERYYMNMRWDYGGTKNWWFGKKIWLKNPSNNKAVVAGILEWGPSDDPELNRVAGASPEAMRAIGAKTNDNLEYCWVADQNITYGSVFNY